MNLSKILYLLIFLNLSPLILYSADNPEKQLNARHSVVFRSPKGHMLNYFAWPTVAKLKDKRLIVAASGFRADHVCPFGMTVIWESKDQGLNWSRPEILNKNQIDNRDAGVTALPDGGFLVSYFGSDTRRYLSEEMVKPYQKVLAAWDDASVLANEGSFVRRVNADGTSGRPVRVPVSAPHGPTLLADGSLLYLGNPFGKVDEKGEYSFSGSSYMENKIAAFLSKDNGENWQKLGEILPSGDLKFAESHVLELPDGKLIGVIRNNTDQNTFISFSDNGGRNWSKPQVLLDTGLPPHIMRHSSGVLIVTYGYRKVPYGERVAFSYDNGKTWDRDWIINSDGFSGDIGYPSTVELDDGSLFTVYYQALNQDESPSILASRWQLPEKKDELKK